MQFLKVVEESGIEILIPESQVRYLMPIEGQHNKYEVLAVDGEIYRLYKTNNPHLDIPL
jgi:hypothetical protein